MSRYIDADAIRYHDMSDGQGMWYVWRDEIHDIPTADVVEVVRCKDCKHLRGNNGHDRPWCGLTKWMPNGITRKLDDYCSYGERREDEQIH